MSYQNNTSLNYVNFYNLKYIFQTLCSYHLLVNSSLLILIYLNYFTNNIQDTLNVFILTILVLIILFTFNVAIDIKVLVNYLFGCLTHFCVE